MRPATLPTVAEYLQSDRPEPEIWAWLSQLPPSIRRSSRVADLRVHPAPGEQLGDEWKPVAEHPEWPVWLVRRES